MRHMDTVCKVDFSYRGKEIGKILQSGFPEIIPSGKHTKNYRTSPFLMGKTHYFYGPFSIAMLNNQRVHFYLLNKQLEL